MQSFFDHEIPFLFFVFYPTGAQPLKYRKCCTKQTNFEPNPKKQMSRQNYKKSRGIMLKCSHPKHNNYNKYVITLMLGSMLRVF